MVKNNILNTKTAKRLKVSHHIGLLFDSEEQHQKKVLQVKQNYLIKEKNPPVALCHLHLLYLPPIAMLDVQPEGKHSCVSAHRFS